MMIIFQTIFLWFFVVLLLFPTFQNSLVASSLEHHHQQRPPTINIINLDHDTDRWNQVTNGLYLKGKVPRNRVKRLPAVYGKHLSDDDLKANTTKLARLFCTSGMIGCFLSHKQFWIQTYLGEERCQIILEDDVIVSENFCDLVDEAIDELNNNEVTRNEWDVLILGAFGSVHPDGKRGIRDTNALVIGGQRKPKRLFQTNTNNILIHIPRRPFGTHAYVLSKRGAQKLLNKAWLASGHVDCVIWGISDLNIYCCDYNNTMLAHQNTTSPSTIGIVPWGPETWFPPNLEVDPYSKVTIKWALGEPLIRIPGFQNNVIITIGRAILLTTIGCALGICLRNNNNNNRIGGIAATWFLPFHLTWTVAFAILLRIISRPVQRPTNQPIL